MRHMLTYNLEEIKILWIRQSVGSSKATKTQLKDNRPMTPPEGAPRTTVYLTGKDQPLSNKWTVNVRINIRTDELLRWDPLRVLM